MADISIRFMMEPQRSLAFGAISAVYASIGTAVNNPLRMYDIQNLTDAPLQFSIDGVDDHFVVPAYSGRIVDIVSNKTSSGGWYVGKGTSFYVKELTVAATLGSVYLSVAYGE